MTRRKNHLSDSKSSSNNVWVVIPAAGVGKRMRSDTPKQYLKINNKTILEYTIACFSSHLDVAGIIVVLHTDDPYWNQLNITTFSKPLYTVEGGEERSDSVMQALQYLLIVEQLNEDSWVMVHDAARPMLKNSDINKLLELREMGVVGGILASPVRDTMKRSEVSQADKTLNKTNVLTKISKTEPRGNLWHALTPQLFKLGELNNALQTAFEKGVVITDEASALEAMGKQPVLVEGCSSNIKITQPADFELAKLLLNNSDDSEQ